jgi:zinc D-Ala-D-Ala carboxypeptidase
MIITGLLSVIIIAKEISGFNKPKKVNMLTIIMLCLALGSCASQKSQESAKEQEHSQRKIEKTDSILISKGETEILDLPIDNGDYDVAYIMGKFDPAKRQGFEEIPTTYSDRSGRYIRKDVFTAYKRMKEAANRDGIDFKIISATRNFDNQKSIWENKWTGKTLLEGNINATSIADPKERALKILKYSSMPGTSRHHWGTDIDLNSLENSYFDSGQGKKEYDWLQKNANKYGFCQTYTAIGSDRNSGYQEERWHWTYMPVSIRLTELAKHILKDEMISGFLGSETAIEIEVVEKYILGISPKCTQMNSN